MGDEIAIKEILLDEYRFMQKSYELQFTHFMAVFYIWIPIVTLPVGAGVLANLGQRPRSLGFLFIFVAVIGILLSLKMFDIRRSQVRYLQRVNSLREALWERYAIESETKIAPLGRGVDLIHVARRDFGLIMAITMSCVHAVLVGVGVWNIFTMCSVSTCFLRFAAILCGLVFGTLNVVAFYRVIGSKPIVQ